MTISFTNIVRLIRKNFTPLNFFCIKILSYRVLRIYPWSGVNQFFVKASMDSLSIGASGGHYGLWLDADLNNGRTQPCETFQNEPLAGESEDFTIQFVEAYGFRME